MEAKAIVLREFLPPDATPIIEIQQASPQMAQWKALDYAKLARNPNGIVLIAAPSGAPGLAIGFLAALAVGEEAEIQNLAVHADYRRQGVARALIEEVHHGLANRGVRKVFLEVRRSNVAAKALYNSVGYSECGLRPRYYASNGEDALVLGRELAAASEEVH